MSPRGTAGERGRAPSDIGLRLPPLAWWAPLACCAIGAALLAVVVLAVVRRPGPEDDRSPADQRPGFLVAPGDARKVAGLALPGDPVGRRPVLVVFDRSLPDLGRYATALTDVPAAVAVVLVTERSPTSLARMPRGQLLVDASGHVARTVGMHRPRDRGGPVGYAVLDARARVRYTTLDPSYLDHGYETALIAKAVVG